MVTSLKIDETMLKEFFHASTLLFVLLNPFLMVVYLQDVIEKLSTRAFLSVMVRAGLISSVVFVLFGVVGDAVFTEVLHARFASFQIFGGVVFLLIGVRFVFQGDAVIEGLRGEAKYVAGAIAMPMMIGPGTVSAAMLAGGRLPPLWTALAIISSVAATLLTILCLKQIHDYVRPRNESLIERYVEITGKIAAMIVGTYAVEMILTGLDTWLAGVNLLDGGG